jgi:hypothetical protein
MGLITCFQQSTSNHHGSNATADSADPVSPERSFLSTPSDMERELAGLVPELAAKIENGAACVQPFVHRIVGTNSTGESQKLIVTQAANDYLDLLFDVSCGRGRPALRTARSLLEHMVALRDVGGSTSLSDRYVEHVVAAHSWRAQLTLPERHVSPNTARSLAHYRQKLARDVQRPLRGVQSKYGSSFLRQWNPATLRDRMTAQSLDEFWPFYALSSSILHGSGGGVIGLVDDQNYEPAVHRIGPALELCPIALLYGLKFFEQLVVECNAVEPGAGNVLLSAIADLNGSWEDYWRAISIIDSKLWPDRPPPGLGAVVQIMPGGLRRWWLVDLVNNRVAPADPPAEQLTDSQEASIADVTSGMSTLSDPITIAVAGVVLSPRVPLRWQHAATVLVQKPIGGWERLGPINPLNPRRTQRHNRGDEDRT